MHFEQPQLQYLLADQQTIRQSANQLNMELWHQTMLIGMQTRVTQQSQLRHVCDKSLSLVMLSIEFSLDGFPFHTQQILVVIDQKYALLLNA